MNCALHPELPAVQPCDRCGNFGCVDCLGAVGSQKLCPSCRERGAELEWDRRRELGLFRAWWLTTRRMLVSPLQTLDVITPNGTILESTIYAGICSLVGIIPTMLLYVVFFGAMMLFGPGLGGGEVKFGMAAGAGITVFVVLFYLGVFIAFSICFLLVTSGIELLILRMGGAKHATYPVAVRAHALSMAPYVTGVVPFCSIYVFPIWALVLRVFAIHKLQRSTAGAGVAAALVPLALCCFGIFAMYAAVFAFAAALSNR